MILDQRLRHSRQKSSIVMVPGAFLRSLDPEGSYCDPSGTTRAMAVNTFQGASN